MIGSGVSEDSNSPSFVVRASQACTLCGDALFAEQCESNFICTASLSTAVQPYCCRYTNTRQQNARFLCRAAYIKFKSHGAMPVGVYMCKQNIRKESVRGRQRRRAGLSTCVVSASKSGNLSPRRRATGFEEDMAIFVPEDGKAFRPKRDDLVASADLRERVASMTPVPTVIVCTREQLGRRRWQQHIKIYCAKNLPRPCSLRSERLFLVSWQCKSGQASSEHRVESMSFAQDDDLGPPPSPPRSLVKPPEIAAGAATAAAPATAAAEVEKVSLTQQRKHRTTHPPSDVETIRTAVLIAVRASHSSVPSSIKLNMRRNSI